MCIDNKFQYIRPYNDSEANKYTQELLNSKEFFFIISKLWKGIDKETFVNALSDINSISEFKDKFVFPMFENIIENTTKGITVDGINFLEDGKTYLFISDHRDIILDSAILNIILNKYNLKGTENAIGSNLLLNDWITNLVKLNNCFTVQRDIPVKEMIESSKLRAEYIRSKITNGESSVWIAQREGRTKDGDDRTQHSLLKMLNINAEKSFSENFKELNIVPLAISYEYEPCDIFKTNELYHKQMKEKYKKAPNEDMKSMIYGMTSNKERVHFSIGKPLTVVLDELNDLPTKQEQYKALADIIDYRIHKNFKLWPDNYIAYDLLESTTKYKERYSENEKDAFIKNMTIKINNLEGEKDILNKIYLEIYANPVKNYINLVKPKFY